MLGKSKVLRKRRLIGATISCLLAAMLIVMSSVAMAEHPVPGVHDRTQLLFLLERLSLYPGPEPGAETADVDADLATVAQELQLPGDAATDFAALREFLRRHVRLKSADFNAYALIYVDPSADVAAQADWDDAKALSNNFENRDNVHTLLKDFPAKHPDSDYARLAQTILGAKPLPTAPDYEEAAYWRLIGDLARRTVDPSVLAAYLDRYPRGAFAKVAIWRMATAAGVAGQTGADALDRRLWAQTREKVRETNDPGYLDVYDAVFPNGANHEQSKALRRTLPPPDLAPPNMAGAPTPPGNGLAVSPGAAATAPPTPADIERDMALGPTAWREVQQALADLGHAPGKADGRPGGRTRAALQKWQKASGLPPTGSLTAPQIARLEADQKIERASRRRSSDPAAKLAVGARFEDCGACPRMKVLPKGVFKMGSPNNERGRALHEGPQRRVAVLAAFAMGVYPVTFKEWDACVADGGCNGYTPDDAGWGRGKRPVIDVDWKDAQRYVAWLTRKTGKPYRLPSEAEWEYAARAGTTTPFSTGRAINPDQANYNTAAGYGGSAKQPSLGKTVPVDRFAPNPFGLFDLHGNAWEWVQDCWHEGYSGASFDAGVWAGGNCNRRVVRGGSWKNIPRQLRSAVRGKSGMGSGGRNTQIGFRVVRDLVQ